MEASVPVTKSSLVLPPLAYGPAPTNAKFSLLEQIGIGILFVGGGAFVGSKIGAKIGSGHPHFGGFLGIIAGGFAAKETLGFDVNSLLVPPQS